MFKLTFDLPISQQKILHQDKVVCLGSCFSDHIADRLSQFKFHVVANPFGTIFNPTSIFRLLKKDFSMDHCIENTGIFYHWDAHSSISSVHEDALKSLVAATKDRLDKEIRNAQWLIITLGSSFVYRLKSNKAIVANCHKIPQSQFEKSLLSVSDICTDYDETMSTIRKTNPDLKVLLTVSPVRHTKDGLHQNNISKGILHQAIHEITKSDAQARYFPSFEIMVDELRDYRFYKADMIHPNDQAVGYIWDKFATVFFDQNTNDFIDDWSKILSGLQHRPFHPASKSHQDFLKSLEGKIQKFQHLVDVSQELKQVQSQLTSQ